MTEKIIIAGEGGQGIMLLGKVMAEAAMRENKFVTWLPAYGAEVRGGVAYCMVIISDEDIGSPYINKANTLIILNQPSFIRFKNRLASKGLFILNSSLVKTDFKQSKQIVVQPFTDIAARLGNLKVANTVALGVYLTKNKILNPKTIFQVMEDFAPKNRPELIEINKQAFTQGTALVKK